MTQCTECRSLVRQVRQGWELLDDLPLLEPVDDFNAVVWRKIEAQHRRAWWRGAALFSPPALRLAAVAAALMLVLGVGYFTLFTASDPAVTFTATDRQDNELLLELEQVMEFDETQVLSIYQPWELSADSAERPDRNGTPPPPENGESEDKEISTNRARPEELA